MQTDLQMYNVAEGMLDQSCTITVWGGYILVHSP